MIERVNERLTLIREWLNQRDERKWLKNIKKVCVCVCKPQKDEKGGESYEIDWVKETLRELF